MSAYGPTPLNAVNGTPLGIAYVRIETDSAGVVQTASRQYWNHATKVFEPGPRVDAKHVLPYQRLSDAAGDPDGEVQLRALDAVATAWPNVVVVDYNLDSSGNVTSVFNSRSRNQVVCESAINITY